MLRRDFFNKIFPALIAAVLFASACILFTQKYAISNKPLPNIFHSVDSENRMLFLINFYFPFSVSVLCFYICLFLRRFFFRIFCLSTGLVMAIIASYVLSDFFTIIFCTYSAYILISAVSFTPPRNYFLTAVVFLVLIFSIFHPVLLGPVTGGLRNIAPIQNELIILMIYFLILAVTFLSVRFLIEKLINSEATAVHLNAVSAKMLLFNHRLQEYVINSGEEIIKKDRLRFTRDLHDSCGYVFTNIIAVTEAAMSFSSMEPEKMRSTYQLISNQARQGLKQTRETLHLIRELEDPVARSIDTIYEMKSIFQEVTNIRVNIESGNMKHDYGPTVNTVLTRIVQEAFTNSIRHGQASQILIHFWEYPESLSMTVTDNGIGTQQIVKGIGLAGMEERLAAVGGSLEAFSPEDGGFRLKVLIPLIHDSIKEAVWGN